MSPAHQVTFERPSDRETLFTRLFDAPRPLVWRAWTDPERLAKWWGPRGFTLTTHHMDFTVGGTWKHTMHGPDRDYPNEIVFLEIQEPERIVYKQAGDAGAVNFKTFVTFEAITENQTKVILRQLFEKPEDLQFVIETYHADTGAIEHLTKLDDYLHSLAPVT